MDSICPVSEEQKAVADAIESVRVVLPHIERSDLLDELANIIRETRHRGSAAGKAKHDLRTIMRFCPEGRGDVLAAVAERADAIYEEARRTKSEADAALESAKRRESQSIQLADIQAKQIAEQKAESLLREERARLARLERETADAKAGYERRLAELDEPHTEVVRLFERLVKTAGYGPDFFGKSTPVPPHAVLGMMASIGAILGKVPVTLTLPGTPSTARKD